MAYYVVREQSDAERFGGCMTFLVIAAIIIGVLIYFAAYVLLAFLALGLLLGCLYCLIVYAKAMYEAIQDIRYNPPQAANTMLTFIKGYWIFFFGVTRHSIIEAASVAQNSFYKFLNYRFLSFQKWMWLVVAGTILVGEVVFTIAIIALQFAILATVIYLVCMLILAALLINLIVALVYTTVLEISDICKNTAMYLGLSSFDFSSSASYPVLIANFPALRDNLRAYYGAILSDYLERMRMFIGMSKAYRLISVRKWFNLASALTISVCFVVYNLIYTVLYLIAFLLIFIVNAIWTTFATLFWLIRH